MPKNQAISAALAAAVVCVCASSAAAAPVLTSGRDLMLGYSVSLGAFYEAGNSDLRPHGHDVIKGAPVSTGITYYERQGLISGYLVAIAAAAGGAYGNTLPKKTTVERKGNWEVTKKYYMSAEEKAKADQEVARAIASSITAD